MAHKFYFYLGSWFSRCLLRLDVSILLQVELQAPPLLFSQLVSTGIMHVLQRKLAKCLQPCSWESENGPVNHWCQPTSPAIWAVTSSLFSSVPLTSNFWFTRVQRWVPYPLLRLILKLATQNYHFRLLMVLKFLPSHTLTHAQLWTSLPLPLVVCYSWHQASVDFLQHHGLLVDID